LAPTPEKDRYVAMEMTRRTCLTVLTTVVAADSLLIGKENDAMKELLETSQNEKKGITLYVKGQSIAGGVVRIAGDVVELKSREFSRIVVRIDAIDAAAMS
jgi:hypothetical protein